MQFDFPTSSGQGSGFEPGSTYKFDIPRTDRSIIKVVGVGGGGSNAVNHMYRMGIKDVEFIVCNTDAQALKSSPVPTKLQIGTTLTEGLGCGANPDVGRAAAIESHEQIREALAGAKMVFITAGMGGGTGTGAAPVIAKIAREMQILTVGIVTMPFEFEGKKKNSQAQSGVNGLRENCDTVLVILNNRLREMFGNLAISQAFAEADTVLTTAAKGIAEIITLTGYVNVDFQDVRTVMKNAGAAVMGSAETKGENRALNAAQLALASPLLDNQDIMGAKRILLSIISGDEAELQMDELSLITNYIQEQAGDRCEVIFGHGVDPALDSRIRVTVIATGFHDARRRAKRTEKKVFDLDAPVAPVVNEDLVRHQQPSQEEMTLKEIPAATEPETFKETFEDTYQEPTVQFDEPETPQAEAEPEFTPIVPQQEQRNTFTWDLFSDNYQSNKPEPGWYETGAEQGEQPEEERLFLEDDQDGIGSEVPDETEQENESIMAINQTKERLEEEARRRREKLQQAKKPEMSRDEFNSKWTMPAYLRRGVKMENVPHSSEQHISRFNLNDDNSILGNNRFLHDNVD
ncbi:MAG: cell division protein FtsZ [Bacteroidota bacterium]